MAFRSSLPSNDASPLSSASPRAGQNPVGVFDYGMILYPNFTMSSRKYFKYLAIFARTPAAVCGKNHITPVEKMWKIRQCLLWQKVKNRQIFRRTKMPVEIEKICAQKKLKKTFRRRIFCKKTCPNRQNLLSFDGFYEFGRADVNKILQQCGRV